MVKSMTGFGHGEALLPNKKIIVEIRTLNSKQLDLSLRIPSAYRTSEYELRNLFTRTIQRGKTDVMVIVESQKTQTSASVNKEVFREYYNQVNDALIFTGIDAHYDAILPVIMRMPEVVSTEGETLCEQELQAIMTAAQAAVDHLNSFREQEGAILIGDLLRRIDLIELYKEQVIPFEKGRQEVVRTRILENLAKLQAEIDNNRLEQEMIFYIEKLDITEEKVRLQNHLNYFREVASDEDGVGRKLGFIAQEIGREVNTMGSKANDTSIQRLVVQMKDELEKIKEQVLNIL